MGMELLRELSTGNRKKAFLITAFALKLLYSWQIQNGSVTVQMIVGAVFFAMQSAVLSVLLVLLAVEAVVFLCWR